MTPAELPQDRLIGIVEIGEEMSAKLPVESIMYATGSAKGKITIDFQNYKFHDQVLLIVASRQEDHDVGYATLRGAFDTIGYLSLIFGSNIANEPILSCYFDTRHKKFMTAKLAVKSQVDIETEIYGVKSFYQLDRFSGEDDNIHAALWFVGKAFTENNQAAKIVFYQTAIEMLYGSTSPHKGFRKLYQGRRGSNKAMDAVQRLKKLRIELVHKGKLGELPGELERLIQLMLFDAIVEKQEGTLKNSAFFNATKSKQKTK